jgi:hypothetical protein
MPKSHNDRDYHTKYSVSLLMIAYDSLICSGGRSRRGAGQAGYVDHSRRDRPFSFREKANHFAVRCAFDAILLQLTDVTPPLALIYPEWQS